MLSATKAQLTKAQGVGKLKTDFAAQIALWDVLFEKYRFFEQPRGPKAKSNGSRDTHYGDGDAGFQVFVAVDVVASGAAEALRANWEALAVSHIVKLARNMERHLVAMRHASMLPKARAKRNKGGYGADGGYYGRGHEPMHEHPSFVTVTPCPRVFTATTDGRPGRSYFLKISGLPAFEGVLEPPVTLNVSGSREAAAAAAAGASGAGASGAGASAAAADAGAGSADSQAKGSKASKRRKGSGAGAASRAAELARAADEMGVTVSSSGTLLKDLRGMVDACWSEILWGHLHPWASEQLRQIAATSGEPADLRATATLLRRWELPPYVFDEPPDVPVV